MSDFGVTLGISARYRPSKIQPCQTENLKIPLWRKLRIHHGIELF